MEKQLNRLKQGEHPDMLMQRVLTALVLIPLVLWLVLFANTETFSIAMMVVITIAAYEWAMLSGLVGIRQYLFAGLNLLLMLLIWRYVRIEDYQLLLVIISAVWLTLTIRLITQRTPVDVIKGVSYSALLSGLVLLLIAWLAISRIHAIVHYGPHLVLALMVMIWIADSAAYFSGRLFGRHKLSPQVSPGKSWEGVAGALIGVAVFGFLLVSHPYFHQVNPFILSLVSVLVAFVSVGGDLFESKIKRQRGVKDSGRILPGHGGVYDRIDSLVAAAPVYLLGITLLVGEAAS